MDDRAGSDSTPTWSQDHVNPARCRESPDPPACGTLIERRGKHPPTLTKEFADMSLTNRLAPAFLPTVAVLAVTACPVYASIISFTDRASFDNHVAFYGEGSTGTNFNAFGSTSAPSLSGVLGDVAWTASAASGVTANLGRISSSAPVDALNFSFGSGITGFGGSFFAMDQMVPNPSLMRVTVYTTMQTSHEFYFNDAGSTWLGFASTGFATKVTGFKLEVLNSTPAGGAWQSWSATAAELVVSSSAVPAPGAVALLGLAGLAGRRRR